MVRLRIQKRLQRLIRVGAHGDLRKSAMGLFHAVKQVTMTGTPEQLATVNEILDEARKKIYLLLAEA